LYKQWKGSFYEKENTTDYLKVTLLDDGAIIDPMGKLRQVFPNVLHLERKIESIDQKQRQHFSSIRKEKKSELELFAQFYKEMTTSEFTEEKQGIMTDVIGQVLKEEGQK